MTEPDQNCVRMIEDAEPGNPSLIPAEPSNLEKLCIRNTLTILKVISPNFVYFTDLEAFLKAKYSFPNFSTMAELIRMRPETMFAKMPEMELVPSESGYWISLKSDIPAFRRQRLLRQDIKKYIKDYKPALFSYTKELEENDQAYFTSIQRAYSGIEATFGEMHINVGPGEVVPAVEEIIPMDPPSQVQYHGTYEDDLLGPFNQQFPCYENEPFFAKTPVATSFVKNERALAKLIPHDAIIVGKVLESYPDFYFGKCHLINKLAEKGVTNFNEIQRLIVLLMQNPFGSDKPLTNLLICCKNNRGVLTAISSSLYKLVKVYKQIKPSAALKNQNPYMLVVALDDYDLLPIGQSLEELNSDNPYKVAVQNSTCSNAKLRQNMKFGCDILLLDRKKVDFIRNGEINLRNLRHVVFLKADTFTGLHESIFTDVHKAVQHAIQRNLDEPDYGAPVFGAKKTVQYVFQTYKEFKNWEQFQRLFYLTRPACNDMALILPFNYPDND